MTVAWLKRKFNGNWADVALWAVVAVAATAVAYNQMVVPALASIPASPERVARQIEGGLERLDLQWRKERAPDELEFFFVVHEPGRFAGPVQISMEDQRHDIVRFHAGIHISGPPRARLETMSQNQRDSVARAIRRELYPIDGIEYIVDAPPATHGVPQEYRVGILKRVPVGSLTDGEMLDACVDVGRAMGLVEVVLAEL